MANSNPITAKNVIQAFERWCPPSLAYKWDNAGLQVGSVEQEVTGILTTLDVTEAVVDEAISLGINFIFAHHPLLFAPLKQIDIHSPKGRVIKKLLQHDLTVYAAHTNLDIVNGGVNDMLAEDLGLIHTNVLISDGYEKVSKLAVYVPSPNAEELKQALGDAGAGHIGNYSHCSFSTEGKGAFKPLAGSNPYLGSQNELEIVDEVKIEVVVTDSIKSGVLAAMKHAHPYEEVAYDLFELEVKGEPYGAGRIGSLTESRTLPQLAEMLKEAWELTHVRIAGDTRKALNKVAILGGSGEDFIEQAMQAGADVYITGDLTYHDTQDAVEAGFCLIDAGHYAEKVMKKHTAAFFVSQFQALNVQSSKIDTNPFITI